MGINICHKFLLLLKIFLLRHFIAFVLLVVFVKAGYAYNHVIDVLLFSGSTLREINISVATGTYSVSDANKELFKAESGQRFTISTAGKKVNLSVEGGGVYNNISTLVLKAVGNDGVLRIKHSGKTRVWVYDDNLTVTSPDGNLKIINNIDIEKYVAGVVEAEAGIMNNIEFYKVQAVACRTYVLRNIRRHFHEGFHVCDKVHCQVYHGKCYNKDILQAAENTKHFVIIDKELNFISAVFHSNCGGQTVNSEHVWTLPSTYLKSIADTFCTSSRNARWEYRTTKQKFADYLAKSWGFDTADTVLMTRAYAFSQAAGRKVYFLDMPAIHLKNIRSGLGLKSTYFSIVEEDSVLVFKGRGFGHGVGLCQEGAMKMIEAGYSYDDIIKFYYTGVYVVSYEDVLKLNKGE